MSVMSNLFLLELCVLTACWSAFLMCLRLNTQTPVRVNESKSIHPRIKKDSPPYTFPYACHRLVRLRSTTPRRQPFRFLSESNRKDNDKL
jgi:hypothetical protein